MKRFRIFAIAAIAIGMFSAFKAEKLSNSKYTPQHGGWVIYGGSCVPFGLDSAEACDWIWTGPICTAHGLPAYESQVACFNEFPSRLLKKQL